MAGPAPRSAAELIAVGNLWRTKAAAYGRAIMQLYTEKSTHRRDEHNQWN